jgi:hypothetical protein
VRAAGGHDHRERDPTERTDDRAAEQDAAASGRPAARPWISEEIALALVDGCGLAGALDTTNANGRCQSALTAAKSGDSAPGRAAGASVTNAGSGR